MEKEENNENFAKIKVFSSEDEQLKILGELLSNKSSRDIIKLLIENEMYTNEITKKLDLRVSLVIHHLQKMESINLLEITNKKIVRNGEMHRFFRIPSGILIFPKKSENETNNRFIKQIFKNGVKFAVITFAVLTSWATSTFNNFQNKEISPTSGSFEIVDVLNKTTDIVNSKTEILTNNFLFIPIIIIGSSLFLIWFTKKYK